MMNALVFLRRKFALGADKQEIIAAEDDRGEHPNNGRELSALCSNHVIDGPQPG